MRESLKITFSETRSTITVRAGGYKATSSQGFNDAALRLIRKIYGYAPIDLKIEDRCRVITWTDPSKKKEVA
jgi:hypothetical protein